MLGNVLLIESTEIIDEFLEDCLESSLLVIISTIKFGNWECKGFWLIQSYAVN